jgi:methyltransferase (TIGR00027 family)
MNEKDASFTAMMTAYMRAYHAMHDTPKIFDDSLAYYLIPEEKRELIASSVSDQTNTFEPLIQTPNALSRARYTEDALEKAVSQGVKQYAILGAGLDTFAFRRPDLMEQLEVFEVDHLTTQRFKLHRINELGWKHPAKLHFVPIDFTKENLATALTRSPSYDPKVKSFFSWLGVTYYLNHDDVFVTLRSIKDITPEGSMIIFDYTHDDAFIPEKSSPQMQKKLERFRDLGEPMITGFNPSTLAKDIAHLGFHLHTTLRLVDIKERYFKASTDGYHAQEYEYIAYATVE